MIKIFSNGIRKIPNLEQFLNEEIAAYGALEGFSSDSLQEGAMGSDAVIGWGHKPTADKALAYAKKKRLPYIALEDGFYRSLRLGAEGAPPLSITVDPIGVYYDASAPSQLEVWLNDWQSWFTSELKKQAEEAISLIKSADLSKYNASPSFTEEDEKKLRERLGIDNDKRLILVVDQTYDDSSVRLGGADEGNFQQMLEEALREENAVVLVKTHPDVLSGKKKGYLTQVPAGVHVIAENWAPLSFMRAFDAVYAVTSQMGFEALLLQKRVKVFGVPFYAGWGLTEDRFNQENEVARLACHRRVAKPSPEALFAASVLKLSRCVNPITAKSCTVPEILDLLSAQRSANERNRGHHVAIGIPHWKKPHIEAYLSGTDSTVEFIRSSEKGLARAREKGAEAVFWSSLLNDETVEKAQEAGLKPLRVEDGFLRSVGLGSDFNYPYSLVLDPDGIYYDPARPSHLEWILKHIHERKDLTRLTERAAQLRKFLVANAVSKYSVGQTSSPAFLKSIPSDKTVILVPGQVDDDDSVKRGGGAINSNRKLLEKVRKDNPEAFIVYKPHPDVESRNRQGQVAQKSLKTLCDLVAEHCSLEDLWPYIKELHTLTSLSGFEALLRGKKVTTYGRPFYAGWGLTCDKLAERKTERSLIIDELVAGTLILYPMYWDWMSGQFCRPEDVCYRLIARQQPQIPMWVKAYKGIRGMVNYCLRK